MGYLLTPADFIDVKNRSRSQNDNRQPPNNSHNLLEAKKRHTHTLIHSSWWTSVFVFFRQKKQQSVGPFLPTNDFQPVGYDAWVEQWEVAFFPLVNGFSNIVCIHSERAWDRFSALSEPVEKLSIIISFSLKRATAWQLSEEFFIPRIPKQCLSLTFYGGC